MRREHTTLAAEVNLYLRRRNHPGRGLGHRAGMHCHPWPAKTIFGSLSVNLMSSHDRGLALVVRQNPRVLTRWPSVSNWGNPTTNGGRRKKMPRIANRSSVVFCWDMSRAHPRETKSRLVEFALVVSKTPNRHSSTGQRQLKPLRHLCRSL
jgi:hypothetical protein